MILSSNQIIPSIFCFLSLVSASYADYEQQGRKLWNFPRAFDFYNNQCQQATVSLGSQDFYNNPCPKCSERFSHFHCNSCCAGGASSMKMAWNGCNGNLTFTLEGIDRCDVTDITDITQVNDEGSKLKFIDCECYDQVIKGGTNDFSKCNLSDSISTFDAANYQTVQDTGGYPSTLICIVSTYQVDDSDQIIVNLTQALPNPLGLQQSLGMIGSTTSGIEQLTVTFFDTSCQLSDGNDYIRPLYPGFGKAPGSCPGDGFVDMHGKMPLEADAYIGIPIDESWFEFLDGTSTSFSPSREDYDTDINFDFTFSSCACIRNLTMYPSAAPSRLPSMLPSLKRTDIPDLTPSVGPVFSPAQAPAIAPIDPLSGLCYGFDADLQPMCACQYSELKECIVFATTQCVGNGGNYPVDGFCPIYEYLYGDQPPASENKRSNQRHLKEVDQIMELIEQYGMTVFGKDSKYSNLAWIQEHISYHQAKLQKYTVDMTYYPH